MFEEIDDWISEHRYKLASNSFADAPWYNEVVYL